MLLGLRSENELADRSPSRLINSGQIFFRSQQLFNQMLCGSQQFCMPFRLTKYLRNAKFFMTTVRPF